MKHTFISFCNYVIEYTFYAIFLTVPFAFTDRTFELFEFNKMWLLFGYAVIIFAAWICKMIAQGKFFIQKTPLDIPLGLFLLSQIASTLFSMDQHLSIWGYYSRFNGGLLSMLSYIGLYYAFVSNISFKKQDEQPLHATNNKHHIEIGSYMVNGFTFAKRILLVSVVAATLVALWGLPSHFGYDPTCLIFRGTFDVSCWTADFQPKIRIFSTLGQPNWLAAYLAILFPVVIALGLHKIHTHGRKIVMHTKELILMSVYFVIAILFYLDIIYTDSQSGYLGTVAALGAFALGYLFIAKKFAALKTTINGILIISLISLLLAFFVGVPVVQLKHFTLPFIQSQMTINNAPAKPAAPAAPKAPSGTALEGGGGGTESSTIRKYVWQGAIEAWKNNPIFGTGVETFAFAYYKYRPAGHNMTSEWDFLYNKAHNEYLNYLATTGSFGFLSYMAIICLFIFLTIRQLVTKHLSWYHELLILGLLAGYISTLISNFFGFSVVIGNVYLFLIPAFVFVLADMLPNEKGLFGFKTYEPETTGKHISYSLSGMQWTGIVVVACIALFEIWSLISFWVADTHYALASNLDKVGQYSQGYQEIRSALSLRGDEPTFQEEQANSDATLAVSLISQKQTGPGTQLANEAMQTINQLTNDYPNNINFLKSQVRIYYTLGQLNPTYMIQALHAMEKAHALAPTDAKIAYNLGVLYGQTGQTQRGIEILEQTIKLKPDYHEAYYALGLFYRDLAIDKSNKVINPAMEQKAVEQMHFILTNFSTTDKQATEALKNWGEQ